MPRPREFDETTALEAALECFWQRGYEATSVRDLAASMGLTAPSLYNAFGDKQQLFARALERYLDCTTRDRLRRLEASLPPKDAFLRFFDEIIEHSINDRKRKDASSSIPRLKWRRTRANSASLSRISSRTLRDSSRERCRRRKPTALRRGASTPKTRRGCCSAFCSAPRAWRARLRTGAARRHDAARARPARLASPQQEKQKNDRPATTGRRPTATRSRCSSRRRAALPHRAGQHRHGRAVQAGLPDDLRRTTACRRSSTTNRRRRRSRSRSSSPARSCFTSPKRPAQFLSERPARARRGAAMAVLADGRPRPDGRAEPPFRASTRRRSSPTRSSATSTRPTGSTACSNRRLAGPRVHGGRLFDRRHGGLSLDRPASAAGPEAGRLPASQALVRCRSGRGRR